jgi:hypothetical protein
MGGNDQTENVFSLSMVRKARTPQLTSIVTE